VWSGAGLRLLLLFRKDIDTIDQHGGSHVHFDWLAAPKMRGHPSGRRSVRPARQTTVSAGPSMKSEPPACQLAEHGGSGVIRSGVYGPFSRQRYLCVPPSGKPHTFSTPADLSDDWVDSASQTRLRSYRHDVREIASALVHLGHGASYRQAAIRASAGAHANGQLVADWLRTFAPVVAELGAGRRWPILLGIGGFTLQHPTAGDSLQVHMAVGSNGSGQPRRLWDARLVSAGERGEWATFLGRGTGSPEVLIVERGAEAAAVALRHWADRPPRLIDART
jgi:hypothetical protein